MREEHHEQIQNFLSKIAKFLIIIPAVIILVAFAIGTRDKDGASQQTEFPIKLTQSPVKVQVTSVPKKTDVTKINLQGPLMCDYTNSEMSSAIFIKNRKIYVQLVRTRQSEEVLVKDDCVYRWITGSLTGQKTCGIGSYLTLFDTLSSFGMLDIDSLMSSLSQVTGKSTMVTPPPASEIAKSCVKKDIPDTQFAVPTAIRFTETPLAK